MDPLQTISTKLGTFKLAQLHHICGHLGIPKYGTKTFLQQRILSNCLAMRNNTARYASVEDMIGRLYSDMHPAWMSRYAQPQSGTSTIARTTGTTTTIPSQQQPPSSLPATAAAAVLELTGGGGGINIPTAATATATATINPTTHKSTSSNNTISRDSIKCICHITNPDLPLIQCQNPKCGIYQHRTCLGLPILPLSSPSGGAGGRGRGGGGSGSASGSTAAAAAAAVGSKTNINTNNTTTSLHNNLTPKKQKQPPGEIHYCEHCKFELSDPFWLSTEKAILPPSKLKPVPGAPPVITTKGPVHKQKAERFFFLSPSQVSATRDPTNLLKIRLYCVKVADEVSNRIHWPKYADIRINGMPVRPYARSGSGTLGINQRDFALDLSRFVVNGRNTLIISGADPGVWIVGLQAGMTRSVEEIKQLLTAPESLEEAVERVKHLVGGTSSGSGGGSGGEKEEDGKDKDEDTAAAADGNVDGNVDDKTNNTTIPPRPPSPPSDDVDDDDDIIMISQQVISLKDPYSHTRMTTPARFTDVSGLQSFELESFLSMVMRNNKWQDPTTLQNSSLEKLQRDVYISKVVEALVSLPEVERIEIQADGTWRPEGSQGEWFSVLEEVGGVRERVRKDVEAVEVVEKERRRVEEEERRRKGNGVRDGGSDEIVIDLCGSSDDDDREEGEGEGGGGGSDGKDGTTSTNPASASTEVRGGGGGVGQLVSVGTKRKHADVVEILSD